MVDLDSRWRPMAFVAIADEKLRAAIADALREDSWAVIDSPTSYHLLQTVGLPREDAFWNPELVVADAFSPGCSGVSLAAGLRDLGWSAPIVLLTRSAERGRVSDDPEDSIYTADHWLGVPIVREIARHRRRSGAPSPFERKEDRNLPTARHSSPE